MVDTCPNFIAWPHLIWWPWRLDLGHVLVYDMLHSSFSFPYVLPKKNLPNKAHNHSMATANLNKSEEFVTNTTAASNYIPRRPRISINCNPPFQTLLHKISKEVLWCCRGICHQVLTFIQIGCGHTVNCPCNCWMTPLYVIQVVQLFKLDMRESKHLLGQQKCTFKS